MRYVDLSHTITDGLVTYQGLPAPLICDFLSRDDSLAMYDDGSEFQIGQVSMVGNTGTYIDCPYHRYAEGKEFSHLFISDLADLEGILISHSFQEGLAIDESPFQSQNLEGKAVLIRTDWATKWGSDDYFVNHPYLTTEAASYLESQRPRLVGIDSYNIDNTNSRQRPVHSILLGAAIPIVEHLCQLHLLPKKGFYFTAVPPKINGMGSFPVRAFGKF